MIEDDVHFPANFYSRMGELIDHLSDRPFDVLFLARHTAAYDVCRDRNWDYVGCIPDPYPVLGEPNPEDGTIVPAPYSWGMFAYVAPTSSLQKLLDAHEVIEHPCDVQWWDKKHGLELATINPLWGDQHSTGSYTSGTSSSWNNDYL